LPVRSQMPAGQYTDTYSSLRSLSTHILGTKIRINYCPTCGKECRDTVLSPDLYHSI